jgi:hypothetical protein
VVERVLIVGFTVGRELAPAVQGYMNETLLLLAAQRVQQVVFTHRLGQRQASVLAARVVEVMKLCYSSEVCKLLGLSPLPTSRAKAPGMGLTGPGA